MHPSEGLSPQRSRSGVSWFFHHVTLSRVSATGGWMTRRAGGASLPCQVTPGAPAPASRPAPARRQTARHAPRPARLTLLLTAPLAILESSVFWI